MKKPKFKNQIFVRIEEDGGTHYLLADESLDNMDDGSVAIYELKEIGTKSTSVSFNK